MYWIPSNSWQLEAFSSPHASNAFSMQDLLLSTIGNWLLLQLEIYKLQESFHKVTTTLRKSFQREPLHQLTSLSVYHPPSLTFQVIVLSLGFLESSQSSQSVFGNRIYRTVAGWGRFLQSKNWFSSIAGHHWVRFAYHSMWCSRSLAVTMSWFSTIPSSTALLGGIGNLNSLTWTRHGREKQKAGFGASETPGKPLAWNHWNPLGWLAKDAAKRFQLADDDPKPLADDGMWCVQGGSEAKPRCQPGWLQQKGTDTHKDTLDIPVVPARGGVEVALGIYKNCLIYRTCMRCAPAKPVRACTLRNWCLVSHVTFEAPLRTSHFSLQSSHSTLHTSHSTLHTSHCTLRTPHFTSHCTLKTPHSTLHTSHCFLHTPHFILHTSRFTVHTSHFSLLSSHSTLHTSHSTLHIALFTPHTSHCTLHTLTSHRVGCSQWKWGRAWWRRGDTWRPGLATWNWAMDLEDRLKLPQSPDIRDRDGWPATHVAARRGHTMCVWDFCWRLLMTLKLQQQLLAQRQCTVQPTMGKSELWGSC